MVERVMRMASGGKCDTSLGEKLAGTVGRKSVRYSFDNGGS